MKVEAIMTRGVQVCHPGDDLDAAAHIMWAHDCGCVPVTDEGDRVVGMLTDRDICMAAHLRGVALRTLTVADTMTSRVHGCRPQDTIDTADAIMAANQVRRLPVLDGEGRLLGILSLNDIARGYQATRSANAITARGVAATLAAISAHRAVGGEATQGAH